MKPLYDFARDPLFSRFPPASASAKPGFHVGYLGEQTDAQFAEFPLYLGAQGYPPINYEIFKWRRFSGAGSFPQRVLCASIILCRSFL